MALNVVFCFQNIVDLDIIPQRTLNIVKLLVPFIYYKYR